MQLNLVALKEQEGLWQSGIPIRKIEKNVPQHFFLWGWKGDPLLSTRGEAGYDGSVAGPGIRGLANLED